MKLLFGSCLALLLVACQPQPAETTALPAPTAAAPTLASRPPTTVAQRLSPIISGYWVSEAYLDAVQRTRSPLAATASFAAGPVTMLLQPTSATADSTRAALVLNLHEGSELTILFRTGQTPTSLPVRLLGESGHIAYELAYKLSPTDTTLDLVGYDRRSHRELSRLAYHRLSSAATEVSRENRLASAQFNGLAYQLNKLLVAGRYTGTDSLGQPLRVHFQPTGEVIGLPFRTYHVQEDFLGGPSGVNALFFDMYSKKQQDLAATYGRDTLRLYTIREVMDVPPGAHDSTLLLKPGRLVYQLLRTRKP